MASRIISENYFLARIIHLAQIMSCIEINEKISVQLLFFAQYSTPDVRHFFRCELFLSREQALKFSKQIFIFNDGHLYNMAKNFILKDN